MTSKSGFFLSGAMGLLVAGCTTLAPSEDPVFLRLTDMEARLIRVERVINNQSLIELANQVDQLQAQASVLRGEIETLRFELDGGSSRQRDLYLDVDQRLQVLESRSARPVAPILAASDPSVAGGSNLSAVGGELLPGATVVSELTGTDRDNYQFAIDLLRAGQYADSRNAFIQFLQIFPTSPLADNAQYWLAETRYVQQDFSSALPEFEKVINVYPDSAQVPGAVLKIGFCYYELERWDDARTTLERVIREYPDTTAARLAVQRLELISQGPD